MLLSVCMCENGGEVTCVCVCVKMGGGGVHVCVHEVSEGFVHERRDGVAEREEERCFL